MKQAIIIPGLNGTIKQKRYQELIAVLKGKGYSIIKNPLSWKGNSLGNYKKQFKLFLNKQKQPVLVVGFSYGAVIALLNRSHPLVKKVICVSLSPVFKEDRAKLFTEAKSIYPDFIWSDYEKEIGKANYAFTKKQSWKTVPRGAPTTFIVGSKELAVMFYRSKILAQRSLKDTFCVCPNVKHQINHPRVLRKIKQAI